MKFAHNIQLRVFCKENDDEEKIKKIINNLIDFDIKNEKIEFKKQKAELFDESKMKIFSIFIKKQKHTSRFLKNLFSKLNQDQKDLLKRQLESRLDKNLHFYIRLDKDRLTNKNEYFICDHGNCFHIDICIAAYPHKREAAKKIIIKLIQKY
jgi:RNA binding exosome subunit